MLKKITRTFIRLIFTLLSRVELIGLDRVPRDGGLLIAVNHLSRVDPPLVFAFIPRSDVTALVADKYQKYPFIRWVINIIGGIWLSREEADVRALKEARSYLKSGKALGIAPEGTRSRTGGLNPAKTGAAYLADKADVPIIPVGVWGTEDAFQKLYRLKRPPIYAHFGQPFKLPPLDRRDRAAGLERNTDEIMCRIAALLPEDYRGVYRDHPRCQELSCSRPEEQPDSPVGLDREEIF